MLAFHSCSTTKGLLFGSLCTGVVADGNVTLQSLTIFNTHEWLWQKPTVYFQCRGEDKVYLPDITAKDQLYNFLGLESWQVRALLTYFRNPRTSVGKVYCGRHTEHSRLEKNSSCATILCVGFDTFKISLLVKLVKRRTAS